MEQNYPKGGKEGKLNKLIEKCLMAMYCGADLREKYVNDQRFLDIWIKYVSYVECSAVSLMECCFEIIINIPDNNYGLLFQTYSVKCSYIC